MEKITFNELPQVISEINRKIDILTEKLQTGNNDQTKGQDLLTIKEAAKLLNLKVPTLYSKVSRREIPFMKVSKRLYFSRKDLINYIKSGQQDTIANPSNDASELLAPRKNHH